MNIFERLESNVRSYCRKFPTVFSSAKGSQIIDTQGRSYIDFLSGGGALNYGHNDPAMQQAVMNYIAGDGLIQGLDLHTGAKADFLTTFEALILQPRKLDYKVQFTGPTGSNGVEAALKLARLVKKRSNVIAFSNSYHGHTLGSLAVTGNSYFRNQAFVDRHNVSFLPFDGYLGPAVNTLDYLEKVIADPGSGVDLPAAVIVETTQAEGGVNVAATKWLRGLGDVCREFGVLLIVDEIQTGVGRTGPFFSFEDAGLYPDIVVLSKSLSGMGLPMTLVLMKPELDQWKPGEHNGTFRGNNLAFVAATEALHRYWQDSSLSQAVGLNGQYLAKRLRELAARHAAHILSVRGKGMLHGVQFGQRGNAQEILRLCFEKGLLLECCGPNGEVVKLSPPLTIERDLLEQGLALLEEAAAELFVR